MAPQQLQGLSQCVYIVGEAAFYGLQRSHIFTDSKLKAALAQL
jgi:hypothetical protein